MIDRRWFQSQLRRLIKLTGFGVRKEVGRSVPLHRERLAQYVAGEIQEGWREQVLKSVEQSAWGD